MLAHSAAPLTMKLLLEAFVDGQELIARIKGKSSRQQTGRLPDI